MATNHIPTEIRIQHLLARAQRLMQQLRETGSSGDDANRQRELWNEAQRCRAAARELRTGRQATELARFDCVRNVDGTHEIDLMRAK